MQHKPFVRSPYNYDQREASRLSWFYTGSETKVIQSAKDECDINTIVRNFGITGQLPPNTRVPRYGDFSEVTDYRSAMQAVREAEESFMAMPARVRAQFDNDPQKFLEFVENPANGDALVELGLATKPKREPQTAPNGAPGANPVPPSIPPNSAPQTPSQASSGKA